MPSSPTRCGAGMARVLAQPAGRIRTIGMSAALVGLLVIWLVN